MLEQVVDSLQTFQILIFFCVKFLKHFPLAGIVTGLLIYIYCSALCVCVQCRPKVGGPVFILELAYRVTMAPAVRRWQWRKSSTFEILTKIGISISLCNSLILLFSGDVWSIFRAKGTGPSNATRPVERRRRRFRPLSTAMSPASATRLAGSFGGQRLSTAQSSNQYSVAVAAISAWPARSSDPFGPISSSSFTSPAI